jgi:putative inorganic carbon (HCO3(-)) transporter
MSLTALAWLVTLIALLGLALKRPVYGLSAYLLTFFMFPRFWWWGDDLPSLRWNLYAGVVLLLVTVWSRVRSADDQPVVPGKICLLLVLIAANATFVHFALAPDLAISSGSYTLLLKFTLLLVLMTACIRDRSDLRIAIWWMVLGATYTGYEVTVNDRGAFDGGRLEGIGAAGVQNANELASLMATILPLSGGLFLTGGKLDKFGAIIAGPLILNVLLLCNSRGAFLASVAGGAVFVLAACGPARKNALKGVALGSIAIVLLLGDPDITNRFMTIFTSSEERDASASSRMMFWQAGLRMIADHPLGAGGDGFGEVYGAAYLGATASRPVHNGFITEATEWGLQGFFLRMLLLGVAAAIGWRTLLAAKRRWDGDAVLIGACILTSLTIYLGTAVFGDFIDDEWGYWLVALLILYQRLYAGDASVVDAPAVALDRLPVRAPSAAGALNRLGLQAAHEGKDGFR